VTTTHVQTIGENFAVQLEPLQSLLTYIEERSWLDLRTEPAVSPAFKDFHFCNVWRELDFTTRYEYIRTQGMSLRDRLKFILLLRHTFSIPTAEMLYQGATRSELAKFHQVHPIQSPAVMLYPGKGHTAVSWAIRHRRHVNSRVDKFTNKLLEGKPKPTDVLNRIQKHFTGIGTFRAYEVFTSLTYHKDFPFNENDITVIGPGAVGPLRSLSLGRLSNGELGPFLRHLRPFVLERLIERAHVHWIPPHWQLRSSDVRRFTVRTMEDCLCEWRKFQNVTGSLRARTRRRITSAEKLQRAGTALRQARVCQDYLKPARAILRQIKDGR